MSSRFLLPCSCGKTIPVATSQAGTLVACECGLTKSVPSIRGLKALPSEKQPQTAVAAPASTSEYNGVNLQGVAFVVGFLLLVGGIALAAWEGYVVNQVDTQDYTEVDEKYVSEKIDELDVMGLYIAWQEFKETGLGEHEPPHHVLARQYTASAFRLLIAGVVLAGLGLGLCVYSVSGASAVRRNT